MKQLLLLIILLLTGFITFAQEGERVSENVSHGF